MRASSCSSHHALHCGELLSQRWARMSHRNSPALMQYCNAHAPYRPAATFCKCMYADTCSARQLIENSHT